MRRIAPLAVLSLVVAGMMITSATARIDHHFTVFTKQIAFHGDRSAFHFREQLFASFNPNDQVGNDRIHCRQQREKYRCRGLIHLNGEVGGEGFLEVNGNFGKGDDRLNIVGGTEDFATVAGKVIVRNHGLHFDLVR